MKRAIATTVLLAAMLFPAASRAQEGWTLDRCVSAAVASSGQLEASRQQRIVQDRAAGQARAERLPSLALNGKADYVNKTMSFQLPAFPGFTPPDIQFGDGKNYDIALALNAPLFTGGSLTRLEKAQRAEARAAGFQLKADSLKLMYDVRGAFYRALAAEAAKASAIQATDRLKRHLDRIDEMISAGTAVEEARIMALARLRDAQKGVVEADTRLRAARLDLARLAGEPGGEIVPVGDLDQPLVADTAGSGADLAARPDLQALAARAKGGEDRAGAAKGAWWPTVSAQAAYHYGKPGVDQISNEWMDYATVGVRLNWTLFDWGARGSRVEQARAAARAVEETRRDVLAAYRSRLATAEARLAAAREQRSLSDEQARLEHDRLDLVSSRFDQGMATESERLDAEDDLTSAELGLVAAQANERLAEVDLLFILGR